MAMKIESLFKRQNDLAILVQKPEETHVGYVIRMDYDEVDLLTNDYWRTRVGGIAQNSLLVATAFDPNIPEKAKEYDQDVVLLRVQGPSRLPQDEDHIRAIIEHHQRRDEVQRKDERDGIEPITHSMLQFGGIKCRVLGTFFLDTQGRLQLGADIEDFQSVAHLRVYKPMPDALEKIVNFTDPLRANKAVEDAGKMGFRELPNPIDIGTVRYTSANRLQKIRKEDKVPVRIQPLDFLARRTAVFGMTRTGKSNTVKTMVASVQLAAMKAKIRIGQLIFDMNGEYANANHQDGGSSISDVFGDNTVRYRSVETDGFLDIRDNFYRSIDSGLELLQNALDEEGNNTGEDMQVFIGMSLEKPRSDDKGGMIRWNKKVQLYRTLLFESQYKYAKEDDLVRFDVGADVYENIYEGYYSEIDQAEAVESGGKAARNKNERVAYVKEKIGDPNKGITLLEASDFFKQVRLIDQVIRNKTQKGILSSSKKDWLDATDRSMLNLLAGQSASNRYIKSTRVIHTAGVDYHSVKGSDHIPRDIYNYLCEGRIVILDLSVGLQEVRERLSKKIAGYILGQSLKRFAESGTMPPALVIYVEEAHNLIGKDADFNTTWPRIAKEGAKAGIALVYSTQEPSSVHHNILANTENMFVTHLNNDDELKTLGKYYDYTDFLGSLKKAQDIGFARIKTLSASFVVPTQILKFDPKALKEEYAEIEKPEWFKKYQNGI